MEGSDFITDCVNLLQYKCHRTNFKRGGSYIGSPDWIKKNEKTTNPINKKDSKYFQCIVTVALNHEELKDPQKLSLLKINMVEKE